MWISHLKYGSKDRNFCTLCLWNKNKTFKHFNPCTNSTYYRSYDDCAQNRDERIKKPTQLFMGHILISLSYLWTFAVTCLCYSSYAPGPLHMPHPWTIIPFPSCQLENAYSFFKANLQSQSLLTPSSFFPDVFWRSKQSGFCPLLYFLSSGTSGTLTSSFFKLYPICNHPVIESATLPFSRDHHLCSRLPTTTIHLASQVVSLLPPHHPTAHPQSLPKAWQWLSTELGFWPWPPGPRVVQPLHYFPAYMQLSWLTLIPGKYLALLDLRVFAHVLFLAETSPQITHILHQITVCSSLLWLSPFLRRGAFPHLLGQLTTPLLLFSC